MAASGREEPRLGGFLLSSRPEPLLAAYPRRARDLARFREEPIDDRVAAFVDRAVRTDPAERRAVVLGEADSYVLMEFARRRAVKALRERQATLAEQAVTALTLVDRDRIDYRDLSVDFPLLAARLLGADPAQLIAQAVDVSPPGTADAFRRARERVDRLTLANCMLLEVRSSYGLGFMETWTKKYDPSTDLATAAIELADQIDGEGSYAVSDLRVSKLPGVWFSTRRRTKRIPTAGCITIGSDHVKSTHLFSHGLLVFVVQVDRERVAHRLARRARKAGTGDRPRAAVAVGKRLALFIGGSGTRGEQAIESPESLARFCAIADRTI